MTELPFWRTVFPFNPKTGRSLGHLQTRGENEGTNIPSQAGYDRTMKLTVHLLLLFSLIFLSGCERQTEEKAQFFVFGTMVDVIVRDTPKSTASAAFTELQQRFQQMHRDWHAWEPGALTAINDAFAEGREVSVPDDIRALIKLSQKMETLSAGRFNASIGGLINLWGFHTSTYPVIGPVPDQAELDEILNAVPSANDIIFAGDKLHSLNPRVQLDFGGIAKGYAVDLAIKILKKHGITSALVNAGGDLKVMGGSEKHPWGVGIRKPVGGFYGGVKITGAEAVFTSGTDQRFLEQGENRYPHIISPFTGQAVQGLTSVTVVSDEGYFADAAATALMVAGMESWLEVSKMLGLDTVMIVNDQGEIFMTPKMSERLLTKSGADLEATAVEP